MSENACVHYVRKYCDQLAATLVDPEVTQDLHHFYNIKCVFVNPSASRCKKCDKRKRGCHSPVAIIEGDWADVCRALNFVRKAILFVDEKNRPKLHCNTRMELACAFYWLLKAFLCLETTHTTNFRFISTEKLPEATLLYAQAVATRRRVRAEIYPSPQSNASKEAAINAFYRLVRSGLASDPRDNSNIVARIPAFGFMLGSNPYRYLWVSVAPASLISTRIEATTLPPPHHSLPVRPPVTSGPASPAESSQPSTAVVAHPFLTPRKRGRSPSNNFGSQSAPPKRSGGSRRARAAEEDKLA
ncbi:unnamed protein product [Fusarium fujikuroi]|uniref:Uncharacterized protein n=1 Tax=Fusarium fujikuroi TaxID=5127 RepID=A0A9Q9RFY8_FUSFU|nr:unnamed protein product [Fusarium fujikuroi]